MVHCGGAAERAPASGRGGCPTMDSTCQTVVDLVDSFGTASSPSGCRLGGMQTDELDGGTRAKQQPRVWLPSSEPHNHGQKVFYRMLRSTWTQCNTRSKEARKMGDLPDPACAHRLVCPRVRNILGRLEKEAGCLVTRSAFCRTLPA